MAKIPRNVIDEIRNSVDIGDVIGRYVQLHQAGKNLIGLCPFHDEKTPSFSVNEEKQFLLDMITALGEPDSEVLDVTGAETYFNF